MTGYLILFAAKYGVTVDTCITVATNCAASKLIDRIFKSTELDVLPVLAHL